MQDIYKVTLPKERCELSAVLFDDFNKFKGIEYSIGNLIKNAANKILSEKLPCNVTDTELLSIKTGGNDDFVFIPSIIVTTEYRFDKEDDIDPNTIWKRVYTCLKDGIPKDWEVDW